MDINQWLLVICLGGVCGAAGQLVRTVAGAAKQNRTLQKPNDAQFSAATLTISIVIGATAGIIAALTMHKDLAAPAIPSLQTILGIMAAGYAGADFIEAFAGKFTSPNTQVTTPIPSNRLLKYCLVNAGAVLNSAVFHEAKGVFNLWHAFFWDIEAFFRHTAPSRRIAPSVRMRVRL